MFSHIGKTRTPAHNLGIASLLSLVAGLVNVVGFFSVQICAAIPFRHIGPVLLYLRASGPIFAERTKP